MRKAVAFVIINLMFAAASSASGYSNPVLTVGIVTQVEGAAFLVPSGESASAPVSVGQGFYEGDRLWVEPSSLARLTDTFGSRLTVAGPAVVELEARGKVRVLRGSVKFKAADGQVISFRNSLIEGTVTGEGAVWSSSEMTQVLGLAGDVKVWHPQLPAARVSVAPGFFTQSSTSFKHLQPKRPVRAGDADFQSFLAKFEKSGEDKVEPAGVFRALASSEPAESEGKKPDPATTRGSRVASDVVEPRSEESVERLKARMAGRDVDDDVLGAGEQPLAAPGAKLDAYGRPIRPRGSRGVASGPHFEVVTGKAADKVLLKKLLKIKNR